MKIGILHPTSWPDIGGIENMVRDQAKMLHQAGHEVTVISGSGRPSDIGVMHLLLPELAHAYPLHTTVRSVLEHGQVDQTFNTYRGQLVDLLDPIFTVMDFVIVHNVFTTHFNLALTRALHDLSSKHHLIAWTHDLTATNSDYALPNPTKAPWNIVRTAAPAVPYVAISDLRAQELRTHLQPTVNPVVIPNPMDVSRLFGFTPEIRESLPSLALADRDFVFLIPSRSMVRKQIEFAIETVKRLCLMGRNPLLLITGAKDIHSPGADQYGAYLRASITEVEAHFVFVSDFFNVHDATLRDLYLLSDCLLFPSRQEGFGLPLVEAAYYRLPAWCGDIPAYRLLQSPTAFLYDSIIKLPQAVQWLEASPSFQAQRKARRLLDPNKLYQENYIPLLANLATRMVT